MIFATPHHYSGYTYLDVLIHVAQCRPLCFAESNGRTSELQFDGLFNMGRSGQVRFREKAYQAVTLARSSDWYHYSLNCTSLWHHRVTAAIVGTHDSCLPVPVFALDDMRVYGSFKAVVSDLADPAQFSEAFRKTEYGHHVLVGALMCKRADARARFEQLPASTRYRLQAEVRRLNRRRRGRPLRVV